MNTATERYRVLEEYRVGILKIINKKQILERVIWQYLYSFQYYNSESCFHSLSSILLSGGWIECVGRCQLTLSPGHQSLNCPCHLPLLPGPWSHLHPMTWWWTARRTPSSFNPWWTSKTHISACCTVKLTAASLCALRLTMLGMSKNQECLLFRHPMQG